VSVLAVNAVDTRRTVSEAITTSNVQSTSKRKRYFGEDWRRTKRIKMELQQVDLFIKEIDDVCKEEAISEPTVPVNQTIDDLIADIDKAIAEAKTFMKALFGDEKAHATELKAEMKKDFAIKPIKIAEENSQNIEVFAMKPIKNEEEKSKKMKPLVSPLPTKIQFEPGNACSMVTKVAVKRKAPEVKTPSQRIEEKPKKKFIFLPVSFP